MGSRKKKLKPASGKFSPHAAYRSLPIHDRIALKAWIYWHGRARSSLQQFLKLRFNSPEFAALIVKNNVRDGHYLIQGLCY